MLISIVMDKVDRDERKKWNEFLDYRDLPTWISGISGIIRRCQYLGSIGKTTANDMIQQSPEATALVLIKDATGRTIIVRAFLDSCSQEIFLSEQFA